MKTLKAIIERASDGGYGIYMPEIPGIGVTGNTEEDAKENLTDIIEMAIEHVEETGDDTYYAPLMKAHKIEFSYDLSGFFKTFNYFDVTAFAKRVNINASLMRCYKTGIKKASTKQKIKILEGIHAVADELHAVKF